MASESKEIGLKDDTVRILVIERPSEDIIDEAVDIFCAAFTEDPPARGFTGGDLGLMRDLGRAVLLPLQSSARLYAATDAGGALVGASFWTLPGKPDREAALRGESIMKDYMAKIPEDVAAHVGTVFGETIPRLIDEAAGIEEAEVQCYICEMLMVRPDHQGRGIARKMFQLAKHQGDGMKVKMGLWTGKDRNAEMYEKFGLTLKSSTKIVPPVGGSWTIHILIGEPAS